MLQHDYRKFFLSTWWGPQEVLGLCIAWGIGGGTLTSACRGAAKSPKRQDFDVQGPRLGTKNDEAETR